MLVAHRLFNPPAALVGQSDVVTAFFERLGNFGVLLIAGALLLGGLAGGAVVYHYERASYRSIASQNQGANGQGETKHAKKNKQDKQKHQKQHRSDPANQAETD